MTDRALLSTLVAAARIGRTDLGETTISLDDDGLTVSVRDAVGERPYRVDWVMVDSVAVDGREVTVLFRTGTRLALVCDSALDLREAILDRCRALPELTSALRALGSRRGHRSVRAIAGEEQKRFFAPLLDARKEAGIAQSPATVLTSFDPDALLDGMRRVLKAFAAKRFVEQGPGRRALEAELFDAIESVELSLDDLRDAAREASASTDDLRHWRAWSRQLRSTFEVADRAWLIVDAALEASPLPPPVKAK